MACRALLDDLDLAAERAGLLTRQLLAFSRRGPERREVLGLDKLVTAFAPMARRLLGVEVDVVVDVGASNVEDLLALMRRYRGSHEDFDCFVVPTVPARKQQQDTAATLAELARIGVPAAYLDTGVEFLGRPEGWGRAQQEAFDARHYHQPSDELSADWDFSGAVEDTRLLFYLGLKVANASRMPAWKPGDEFEAARKKAIAEVEASKAYAAQP